MSLTRVAPRVVRLTPQSLPGVSRPLVPHLNRRLLALQVRMAVRTLRGRAVAAIDANALTPTLSLLGEDLSVFWAQDDFIGMAPLVGVPAAVYERSLSWLMSAADAVIAANPDVAATFSGSSTPVHLIPFGCDADLFATSATALPAPEVRSQGPVAIVMGTVNERLDLSLLNAVADTGITLLMVGPEGPRFSSSAFDDLASRDNVQWVGRQEFKELPHFLAHAAVGLVPYSHSRFNEGSFPLKTLEYLAAGLPVVATDLPAIRWLDSPFIEVADDPIEFARAVVEAAHQPRPELAAGRTAFAREHGWDRRATAFAEVLGRGAAGPDS